MGFSVYPVATNRVREFTSSGTFVCPSGVYSAKFLVVGAGGAGGGTSQTALEYAMGGGGGGGAVKEIDLAVTPGTSYTITIGAKGTGVSTTAGGAGGFSEVLNGATSLIKCFGGNGGGGSQAQVEVAATITQTLASGGGRPQQGAVDYAGGGGGGAFRATIGQGTQQQNYTSYGEGTPGRSQATSTLINAITAVGNAGINGYGAGGGGGLTYTSVLSTAQGGSSFAGNGGSRGTAGVTTGGAAIANTGCGGGGSVAFLNATSTTGGNGA